MPEAQTTGGARNLIGTLLVRVVVPLWVLTGALFKLAEANPALLPRTTILAGSQRIARSLHAELNLDILLASLISLEFLAVAVMVFLARFARPMAIFVLSLFCLILIGEIRNGNTSCGCLGAYSPNPWVMLAIDGALLVGVILFRPLASLRFERASWPIFAAVGFVAITSFTSFALLTRGDDRGREVPVAMGADEEQATSVEEVGTGGSDEGTAVESPPSGDGQAAGPPAPPSGDVAGPPVAPIDARTNPAPRPLPKHWFEGDVAAWVDKPWREIDLFQFMKIWPEGLDEGTRYVVFYSLTCDHCEEMFRNDFAPNPELARQVTAVRKPDDVDRWNLGDPWEMPKTEVEHLELPMGTNWIIETPLSLRVEDGIVRCAEEGGHARCMELEE